MKQGVRLTIPKTVGSRQSAPDRLVCPECGSAITPDQAFCEFCKAAILRRYCPACSRLVPDFTKSCPYCSVSATQKPHQPIHIPFQAKVVGGLLLLLALLIILLRPDDKMIGQSSSISTTSTKAVPTANNSGNSAPQQQKAEEPAAAPVAQPQKNDEEGTRLNLQGHRLIQEGRYREAVPVLFKAANSFAPDSENIARIYSIYNLGHALRRIGRAKEAIPYLEKCVVHDPENTMYRNELNAAKRDAAKQ